MAGGPPVGVRLYGYYHLIGKTVTVWGAGLDLGDYLVSPTGTIDIPLGAASGSFTAAGAGQPFVVGYNYVTQGQILPAIVPPEAGTRDGPALGKTRRTHMFAARLANTAGISFGTSFTAMHAAAFKTPGQRAYSPGQLFSGTYWDTVESDYSFDGGLAWQITRPYPATVLAVEMFLQTQDR